MTAAVLVNSTISYADTRSSLALDHTRIPGVTELAVGPDGAVYFSNGSHTYRARCGVVSPFGPAGALVVDPAGAVYIANDGHVDR